ncbi:GNAT family N-acetyltransferase [Deinococcus cellulosilyticus]|uniref:N-acetyltransferase domain-containing protein n=1 Tax=Deinococcus cellulosilyticus (strain DSM 18568 / NBRC 106333 / KACC 11606 / 5516J-15) TaxID=1223518 RepID=A0A511N832_DEIC1|nr:GNAT family N-acetyltransferase [Deinococcus cellulosilyticus]GEM48995.1 hypothetical protein DC3_46300 [Deinococcus cellulosilyticus NBRC 106333 = KACC 11606]
MQIRLANRKDSQKLTELCLEWEGAPATQNPELLEELWFQTLTDDDSSVYIAQKESQLLGFVHVTYQARPARLGWRATIEELHTTTEAPELYHQLLEAVVAECRRRGDVIALYLITQPDLEPSLSTHQVYADLGFKKRGREVLIWTGEL